MFGKKKEEAPKKEEPKEGEKKDGKAEDKGGIKALLFKVMTIVVYLGGIGGPGFMASLYFIIFWMPEVPEKSFDRPYYSRLVMDPPNIAQANQLVNSADINAPNFNEIKRNTDILAKEIITAIRKNYTDADDGTSRQYDKDDDRKTKIILAPREETRKPVPDPSNHDNPLHEPPHGTEYGIQDSYPQGFIPNFSYDSARASIDEEISETIIEKRSSDRQAQEKSKFDHKLQSPAEEPKPNTDELESNKDSHTENVENKFSKATLPPAA